MKIEENVFEHWDAAGHRLNVVTSDKDHVWFEILESESANVIHCASVPKALIGSLARFLEAS